MTRQPPPLRSQARDLVLAANLEMDDLTDIQYHARDDAFRVVVARQIASISSWRERLLVDMATTDEGRMRTDMANLERAMRAGGATAPQPPRPADNGRPYGGYDRESLPPSR
jgi:hypothetical protein